EGFGYTMSRSLARFGLDVKLMSVIGTDEDGDRMLLALEKGGVEIKNVQRLTGRESSKTVVIRNQESLHKFSQDFDINAYIKMIEAKEWMAVNCEWLIVQPEFIVNMLDTISNNRDAQRSFIFTSLEESQMQCLPENMNQFKLAVIGIPLESQQDNLFADHNLLDRGLENLVVTDGKTSIKVISSRNEYEIPVPPGQDFDLTKGLSEFAGGVIYGVASGYPLRQAIRIGMGVVNRAEGRE
ncbi:MAG: PfkB family carbohydrate kinase, partial [Ignavibacteriales bacterium]